nr:amino acid permease 6-like [Ipomoea batatas]
MHQPNDPTGQPPARTALPPPASTATPRPISFSSSPLPILVSSPVQNAHRPPTPAEPMIISPPNAAFGTFGVTRSPFTPMQAMPTIADTLSDLAPCTASINRPLFMSGNTPQFPSHYRSLDPTVPRGVRSKLTQRELNSLDEWLGEGVQMMVPRDNHNMVEPPNNRAMATHYHAIQGDSSPASSLDAARLRPSTPFSPPESQPTEYDPHDPLFARGHSANSHPRPLHPHHPDHIDFIRRGATHEATLKELEALRTTHTTLQHPYSALQSDLEKQQAAHTRALESAIDDWQGTEDFSRAAGDYACSRMPGLLRYWLSSPDRSSQGMVDVMSGCITGWKLPEYLPLRRPPAPIMPASTTTPADGFLISPERVGATSSVALPSNPVGGSGAVGSLDPSSTLHGIWFLVRSSEEIEREMETGLSFGTEEGRSNGDAKFDDDGLQKRTGTMMTAGAHIITGVIGSGVLSLAWAFAQLGWIAGAVSLLAFAIITCYTSILLVDCYRSPNGTRNYTYMAAVTTYLGGLNVKVCGTAHAISKSNCYHKYGHDAACERTNNTYTILFGVAQIILSQIPNFHKLSFLSIVAAVMSFAYSSIGLGLSIDRIATDQSRLVKCRQDVENLCGTWRHCDTIKASPKENKVMKQATFAGILISTVFYMLCGVLGYAAFGNHAPSNFLTGFGFYDPFWLVDLANVCIIVHLLGAYQVFTQPLFAFVEERCKRRWPESRFVNQETAIEVPCLPRMSFSAFRLVWRSAYVVVITLISMLLPFFNDFVGLIGAAAFWPLTVYLPIQMYIARAKIRRLCFAWIWLQVLSMVCFVISVLAAAGSIRGLIKSVKRFQPFHVES